VDAGPVRRNSNQASRSTTAVRSAPVCTARDVAVHWPSSDGSGAPVTLGRDSSDRWRIASRAKRREKQAREERSGRRPKSSRAEGTPAEKAHALIQGDRTGFHKIEYECGESGRELERERGKVRDRRGVQKRLGESRGLRRRRETGCDPGRAPLSSTPRHARRALDAHEEPRRAAGKARWVESFRD